MPKNLRRYYGHGDLHFVTFSCYRRLPLLGTARARNAFVRALREVRRRFGFALVGYVVMPEHVHLLIGEPKGGTPSAVLHSLQLRVSQRLRRNRGKQAAGQRAFRFAAPSCELRQFWQRRFYDFNVWGARKRRDKLEYRHRNPVTRKLVSDPKEWMWSSYASYSGRGTPLVEIDCLI